MASITCNNSLTNIKESRCSIKRINNLSNRIKNLENDIEKIKNSKKKTLYSNNNPKLEKNYSMIVNDSNIKKNLKNAFKINKTIVKNPYFFRVNKKQIKYRTQTNSLKKNKSEKNRSNVYKKIPSKNYTQIIHDKRNIYLNVNSNLNKKEKETRQRLIQDSNYNNDIKYFHKYMTKGNNSYNTTKNNINEIQSQKSQSKKYNRLQHFLSVDKINTNSNLNTKNKIEENKDSDNFNLLDMEFEIRNLKKRKKFLMKRRSETEEKLISIKNENMKLKESIIKQQNYNKNVINNLILLNKEYLLYKNQNEIDEVEDDGDISDKKIVTKDIIFNLMDMKIEYEKNLLYDEFIEGLNELLKNISILNNINNSDNNIANKINRLLHLKNKLKYLEEKYSNQKQGNDKYYIYFTSLLNQLNLNNFYDLKEFIINIFIKNKKENKRMKEITNALINESLIFSDKKDKEKSNQLKYINNTNIVNRNIKRANYDYIKYKNKTSHKNINNIFRNKRNNSSNLHGMCYNSFLYPSNKRNLYNNTKISKKNTEIGLFNNNNEFNQFQQLYNENDIYFLRNEEEKN